MANHPNRSKNDPAAFHVAGFSGVVLPETMQVAFSHCSGGGGCIGMESILDDAAIRPAMEAAFRRVTGRDAPKFGQKEGAA